MVEPDRPQRAV